MDRVIRAWNGNRGVFSLRAEVALHLFRCNLNSLGMRQRDQPWAARCSSVLCSVILSVFVTRLMDMPAIEQSAQP